MRTLLIGIFILSASSAWAQDKVGALGQGYPLGTAQACSEQCAPEEVTPPEEPNSPFPADGATLVHITTSLSYQTAGALTHAIYFDTVSPPTSKYILSQASFTPPMTLESDTVYYWYIEVCNVTPLGGTTGQCTIGPEWSFTTGFPGPAPSSILAVNPTNGAGGVVLTPSLICSANDATSYELRASTTNPPAGAYTAPSATCSYAPGTYSNSVTVYWQVRATGPGGTTSSSVFSFTTVAAAPPTPDPLCESTTVSATGSNHFAYTPCRQDTWDQMEANYIASTSCTVAATCDVGGTWYRWIKNRANGKAYNGSACGVGALGLPTCYADSGQFSSWMVAAEGCASLMQDGVTRYADRTYARLDSFLDAMKVPGFATGAYNYVYRLPQDGKNVVRNRTLRIMLSLDVIRPCITQGEYEDARDGIAHLIQTGLLAGGGWVQNTFNGTTFLNLSDSDNAIGEYFHTRVHCLVEPALAMAISNCQNINTPQPQNGGKVGGLDSVYTPLEYLALPSGKTARDAIRMYVEFLSEDGAWMEGNHYDLETVSLMLQGYDAIKRLTGEDHYPEITNWLSLHAKFLREQLMPDVKRYNAHGELTSPRDPARASYVATLMELASALDGTTEGEKLQALILEMGDTFGFAGTAFPIEPTGKNENPFFYYNPYMTAAADWRGDTGVYDQYARVAIRKAHGTNPNTCQFNADFFGTQRWDETRNTTAQVQHTDNMPGAQSWDLYCDGEWKITDVKYNPLRAGADGGNTVIVHGRARQTIPVTGQALNYVNMWTPTDHTNYYAVAMTTGGAKSGFVGVPLTTCTSSGGWPDVFWHEQTRRQIYLPSEEGTQVIVTHDRVSALPTVPDLTCYAAADQTRMTNYNALPSGGHVFLVNHTQTLPTLASNTYTWASANASSTIKMTVAFPSSFDSTIVNETTGVGYSSNWTSVNPASERKWHIRNGLTGADQQWNTFLTVHQVYSAVDGAAGTITALSTTGIEGAHITRDSLPDAVVAFNSTQGADLTPTTGPSAAHNEQLDVVRFRSTGFTLSWTSVASSTYVILNDLNPSVTWTYTINGGASTALTEDASGNAYIELSGSGAKTLVVTGS